MNQNINQNPGKGFMTLAEAAQFLNASVPTVRRAVKARRLASYRPGGTRGKVFIRTIDLEAWLERSRRSAIGE